MATIQNFLGSAEVVATTGSIVDTSLGVSDPHTAREGLDETVLSKRAQKLLNQSEQLDDETALVNDLTALSQQCQKVDSLDRPTIKRQFVERSLPLLKSIATFLCSADKRYKLDAEELVQQFVLRFLEDRSIGLLENFDPTKFTWHRHLTVSMRNVLSNLQRCEGKAARVKLESSIGNSDYNDASFIAQFSGHEEDPSVAASRHELERKVGRIAEEELPQETQQVIRLYHADGYSFHAIDKMFGHSDGWAQQVYSEGIDDLKASLDVAKDWQTTSPPALLISEPLPVENAAATNAYDTQRGLFFKAMDFNKQKEWQKRFGARVALLRRARGIVKKEIPLSGSCLFQMEQGYPVYPSKPRQINFFPNLRTLETLAGAFKVSIDCLLDIDGPFPDPDSSFKIEPIWAKQLVWVEKMTPEERQAYFIEIGTRVSLLTQARGLTFRQLSKESSVSVPQIDDIRAGKTVELPSHETLKSLGDALKTTVGNLIDINTPLPLPNASFKVRPLWAKKMMWFNQAGEREKLIFLEKLGQRIALLRKARGLMQKELARASGIHDETLMNIELGRGLSVGIFPKRETLKLIAVTLRVSQEVVLNVDGPFPDPDPSFSVDFAWARALVSAGRSDPLESKTLYLKWGKRLKLLREARGLTQAELIARSGIGFSVLQTYENGKGKEFSPETTLKAWADVLKVTVETLLDAEGPLPEPDTSFGLPVDNKATPDIQDVETQIDGSRDNFNLAAFLNDFQMELKTLHEPLSYSVPLEAYMVDERHAPLPKPLPIHLLNQPASILEFGAQIRTLRRHKGLSLGDLGAELQMDTAVLSRLETGKKTRTHFEVLAKIIHWLQVSGLNSCNGLLDSSDQANLRCEFGEKIKRLRMTLGLSQVDFSHRLEVANSLLSRLEAGKKPAIGLELFLRIAKLWQALNSENNNASPAPNEFLDYPG